MLHTSGVDKEVTVSRGKAHYISKVEGDGKLLKYC